MTVCYLFSRRDWTAELEEIDAASLATSVFFQMWRTRMSPYSTFAERDVVYIGDPATRRVLWEVRVSALLTDFGYRSTRHALSALHAAYGLRAEDLNDYHRSRSGHGWLLAWSPTVMRKVDVILPPGTHFGQNGYRVLPEIEREQLGLKPPRRGKPLATPPPWYEPEAAISGEPREVPRYIPLDIREQVAKRDGYRCVGCGRTKDLHFDHVLPYSHGGPATVGNLRLVCSFSNLKRGAGDPAGPLACASSGRSG